MPGSYQSLPLLSVNGEHDIDPDGLDVIEPSRERARPAGRHGRDPHIGHPRHRLASEYSTAPEIQIDARVRLLIHDRVRKAGDIKGDAIASNVAAEQLDEIQMHIEHFAGCIVSEDAICPDNASRRDRRCPGPQCVR